MTTLFLDKQAQDLHFEKIAMPIKLSDNVDNWQREVSSEIFKYLPFLSEYAVNVLFQRVNPERGYAYGSAEVKNLSEGPDIGGKVARIPIIVRDRLMAPVDVFFFDDTAYPMSEDRLREALFDGSTFETTKRKPLEQGLTDDLQPPVRQAYGYNAGATTGNAAGGDFGKMASLCEAIAPTISPEAADALVDRIMEDQGLKIAAQMNAGFLDSAMAIARGSADTIEKTARALVESIIPTVVQIEKKADGNFKVKWANAEAFAPQESDASPADVKSMAGSEAPQALDQGEAMTMGTQDGKPSLDEPTPVMINEFGQYNVRVEEGNQEASGWVIPVVDFDMDALPLYLFTDGQQYSLQDTIVGSRVGGDASEIPVGEPKGNGAFFHVKPDGSAVCTPPITIQNQTGGEEGDSGFMAQDAFGNNLKLSIAPGLQSIEPTGEEGSYAIPDSMQWTPLGEAVHLLGTEKGAETIKEAQSLNYSAAISCSGHDEYHLRGAPFSKLAQDKTQWITKNAAEFLLVAAGMNQFSARSALEKAASSNQDHQFVNGLNTITPLADIHSETIKEASALLGQFPYELRRDMVKEAAVLQDSETADKILAMNFLNPENVAIFAGYLPELDATAQKLAEMLVAVRMGMNQMDEGAVERAMKNLEEVIQGLKAMQQKELL